MTVKRKAKKVLRKIGNRIVSEARSYNQSPIKEEFKALKKAGSGIGGYFSSYAKRKEEEDFGILGKEIRRRIKK